MRQQLYGTKLSINLTYLKNNFNFLKSINQKLRIIAMVKANAYGHGDILITKQLEELGVDYFGVADFEEGIRLRQNQINSRIMIMNPSINNLTEIIKYNLEPVVYSMDIFYALIKCIKKEKIKNNIHFHVKINTGMNRWGFDVEELVTLMSQIKINSQLILTSVYSHLASSDTPIHDNFTNLQVNKLISAHEILTNELGGFYPLHIFNSNGILRHLESSDKFTFCRLGMLLYGGINHPKLSPISELSSTVLQVREVGKNESIGYYRKFVTKRKIKIAVIPFGYADGLQRSWGNGVLKFFYKGHLLPTVGHISMDSCIVDVSMVDNISVGDEIFFFCNERPVWDLARELNSISYEILSTLSKRIKRVVY